MADNLRCDCAPMEGLTGVQFRRVHSLCFGGISRYYTPFVAPTQNHRFTRRDLRELLPEYNSGLWVVPQLLTKSPEDFLWAAGALADMGYREVNLNLGCPSGTVTAKGKGAGMLADPDGLERFLEAVFAAPPLDISIKTRLGVADPEEFSRLAACFNRYPIKELIVHARVREDFYRYPVRREAFVAALACCRMPVCCNGDLFTVQQLTDFRETFPTARAVLLGRGLAADPALARKAAGGAPAEREELENFLALLFDAYCRDYGSRHAAMLRMKELWCYLWALFEGEERCIRTLRKAKTAEEYEACAAVILQQLPLRTDSRMGELV